MIVPIPLFMKSMIFCLWDELISQYLLLAVGINVTQTICKFYNQFFLSNINTNDISIHLIRNNLIKNNIVNNELNSKSIRDVYENNLIDSISMFNKNHI